GLIYRFEQRPDVEKAEVFLDLRQRVTQRGGEEGLLGLAFAPDYANSGRYYVYYSPADEPRRTVLARLTRGRDDPEILLQVAQPYPNHKGGWIAFGPDGMLYVALGDGGSANDPQGNAQNLDKLLGKILRLTSDGKPAPGNPFIG